MCFLNKQASLKTHGSCTVTELMEGRRKKAGSDKRTEAKRRKKHQAASKNAYTHSIKFKKSENALIQTVLKHINLK